MRISARNALPGKIVDIKKGATTAHVRIDVNGTIVTASITNEAVDDLGLKVGDKVHAVIKASDVMVAIPQATDHVLACKEGGSSTRSSPDRRRADRECRCSRLACS